MTQRGFVLPTLFSACLLLALPVPARPCEPQGCCCGGKEPPEQPVDETLGTHQWEGIERLHSLDGIFLASQPGPEAFELAKKKGIRTVINQRHEKEITGFDERAAIASLGMTYHNPAFKGPDELTDELLDATRRLLMAAPRPLLIHCASANRTGATWLAYRALDDGLDWEAALREARKVGLRSPEYEKIVKSYVERREEIARKRELRPATENALHAALEDERAAETFYAAVIDRFGSRRPFSRIIEAERRHQQALIQHLEASGAKVPPERRDGNTIEIPPTFEAACRVAAQLEVENVALYDRLLEKVTEPEVIRTLQRLQAASRDRHLPAFRRHAGEQ